jgi:hypothetical protein
MRGLVFNEKTVNGTLPMSFPLLRQGDTVERMSAEFNAIMTASFDNIGSRVALDCIYPLSPTTTTSSPSLSEKNPTRRFAASFFRKVKLHAYSLLPANLHSFTKHSSAYLSHP